MYLMRLIENTNDYLCNIILSQGSYGFTDLHKYYIHIGVYQYQMICNTYVLGMYVCIYCVAFLQLEH